MIQRDKEKLFSACLMFLFSVIFALMPIQASAAEIFFETDSKEVNLNDKFEIRVFINTQDESINAVEGQIIFPSDYLQSQEVNSGNSNITFWVRQPELVAKGSVLFSGVTPGGFTGNKVYLFSLIFQATKKGNISIVSNSEKSYLNDGKGSIVKTKGVVLILDVMEKESVQSTQSPVLPNDTNPPESFEPQIAKDPDIFEGKWFLVFATQDKDLGIDHYEVKEYKYYFLASYKDWIIAKSPYVLNDQNLKSYISIKAVDKLGNEKIIKIDPQYSLKWYESWLLWPIIVIAGIILYIFWRILRLKKWKQNLTIGQS